jgi:hypothetical protein
MSAIHAGKIRLSLGKADAAAAPLMPDNKNIRHILSRGMKLHLCIFPEFGIDANTPLPAIP